MSPLSSVQLSTVRLLLIQRHALEECLQRVSFMSCLGVCYFAALLSIKLGLTNAETALEGEQAELPNASAVIFSDCVLP